MIFNLIEFSLQCSFEFGLQCDFQFSLQCDFEFSVQCNFQFSLQCNYIVNLRSLEEKIVTRSLDKIHPIDLKFGTYNKLHLYFQLSDTIGVLLVSMATIVKKMTSQSAAILDF